MERLSDAQHHPFLLNSVKHAQALAMGLLTAGHGKKKEIAASCVATLNTLPSFAKYGGIKVESMTNKLRTLVAEHRAAVKKDPHVSGKRTGASEELHTAMCDIVQDLDEAAAVKGEGDAAAVAEEARKNVRAEKVSLHCCRHVYTTINRQTC